MSLPVTKRCRKALEKTCHVQKTKQEFAKEADINNIVSRMERGQAVPQNVGEFADVSGIGDLATMMRTVTDAQAAFNRLHPKLREKFGNDPRQLIAFLGDADNRAEAEKLGLVKKAKAEAPRPEPSPAPAKPEAKKEDPTPPKT